MARSRWPRPLQWAALLLVIYWAALFIGTHTPQLPRVRLPSHADKVVHFLGYAGLAFLAAVVVFRRSRWSYRTAWMLLLGLGAYAAVDELLQIPVPGRSADVWDGVADILGAAAGIIIFRLVQKALQMRREARQRLVALERG